jgi:hypothetical protein
MGVNKEILRCPFEEQNLRRALFVIIRELHDSRHSLACLYQTARRQQREIRELKKKISAFVEPS